MNWLFTPAYCKAKMLEDCLRHLYATPDDLKDTEHVVIDNHYPVDKERNRIQIQALCSLYGCTYVDSGYDRGLHDGLNSAMRQVGVRPEDSFVGCDPDDRPSPGAIPVMRSVMKADPLLAVLALNFWVLPWKQGIEGAWPLRIVNGHQLWAHPGVEMWNVAAFNMRLIFSMGGFSQPNQYYGGIEVGLVHEMRKNSMYLGYLVDHTSEAVPVDRKDPTLYDESYGEWKIAHATRGYMGSYEDWIIQSIKGEL